MRHHKPHFCCSSLHLLADAFRRPPAPWSVPVSRLATGLKKSVVNCRRHSERCKCTWPRRGRYLRCYDRAKDFDAGPDVPGVARLILLSFSSQLACTASLCQATFHCSYPSLSHGAWSSDSIPIGNTRRRVYPLCHASVRHI